jgi:hypothetical protein
MDKEASKTIREFTEFILKERKLTERELYRCPSIGLEKHLIELKHRVSTDLLYFLSLLQCLIENKDEIASVDTTESRVTLSGINRSTIWCNYFNNSTFEY